MADKDIIELPDGRKVLTTPNAAKRLKVISRRVLQFIKDGRLESVQIEEGGKHYVLLDSLETFAKLPRRRGRPVSASTIEAKPAAKKTARKASKT
jgi:hypothetical protein